MKIVVGSSDLGLSVDIINEVVSAFVTSDEPFGIRAPYDKPDPASPVECLVDGIGSRLNRAVEWFSPARGGRSAVFHRDYAMMARATEVLAFFSPDRELEGGTGHVVKAALDRGIKVEAYAVRPDGTLVYLGSEEADPEHRQHPRPNQVLMSLMREVRGDDG